MARPPVTRRAVLVAGVHRSGTSALTRTLSLVGGALAADLLEPVADNNERGFWEPAAIVELHDRVLLSAGSSWDDVSRFPPQWFASDAARVIGDELLALLQKEFRASALFAVKDPRICRLIPLWLSVLPRFDTLAQFVLPIRNPVEVASSLRARDGFPMAKGYLVWLRNALDAERATRGRDRVIVTYEQLLSDWRGVVDRIGEVLQISWPRLSRRAESEIEEFLSPGLRHQQFIGDKTGWPRDVPRWVVTTYEALLRLDEDRDSATQDLDEVGREVDEADDTYGRALAGVGITLDGVKAQLKLAGDQNDRLQEELQRARAESSAQGDALRRLADEQKELRRHHEQRVDDVRRHYQGQIEAILSSTSWRLTGPLRRVMEIARGVRRDELSAAAITKRRASRADYVRRVGRNLLNMTPLSPATKVRIASTLGAPLRALSADCGARAPDLTVLVPDWRNDAVAVLPPVAATPDRVLVVDWRLPTPDKDSGSYRMIRILRCLAASGAKVDFASDAADGADPRYRAALESMGIRVLFGPEALLKHLEEHGTAYRAVMLSRPEVAHDYLPMIRAFAGHARVIYDTVDLHWIRFSRGSEVLVNAEHLRDKAEKYRALELANARCADVTVAITEEERTQLLAEIPDLDVTVLPNIHELSAHVPSFAERRDMLFIGGFTHEPNVDAVHYFVSDVLPFITRRLGNVRLRIVGSDMPPAVLALKSGDVDPVGYVADVDPLFEQARVFVAPLRHGAGMKGKVGHALSYGLPVVTTSIGAEGFGLVGGENALISDDPKEFAEMVVRAYSDETLWNRLSTGGRDLIKSRFSEDAASVTLRSLFGDPVRA